MIRSMMGFNFLEIKNDANKDLVLSGGASDVLSDFSSDSNYFPFSEKNQKKINIFQFCEQTMKSICSIETTQQIKECFMSNKNGYFFVKCYYDNQSKVDNAFIYKFSENMTNLNKIISYKAPDTSSNVYNVNFHENEN